MAKNLVIVESPAKADTIEGFLGADFKVKSSNGHVRDLVGNDLSVDVNNNFLPTYEIMGDKKKIVDELKKDSQKAELVWLATDEDREGEAISWHLVEALGIDKAKIRRITFNEITKPAILKAIENPRTIDEKLVDTYQARRVLDRLVGYELSPVLWKKVRPKLSAGRVQSVSVRLIVEREREIQGFKNESYFKVSALFNGEPTQFKAEFPSKINAEENAQQFLESCVGAQYTVDNLEIKPSKSSPSAPFTTSTLQQEASRKLGFSLARTMRVAQKLYESGRITYMRTDSVNLSETAIQDAQKVIASSFGEQYVHPRKFSTKSKGAQEAHEAIRPTSMERKTIDAEFDETRLYELIWKRAMASQMSDAQIEKTKVTIGISTSESNLTAHGEVVKFDGFLKLYRESVDDNEEEQGTKLDKGELPPMKLGQELILNEMLATQRFSKHPPRYTEASLVKKLEELGIGRPSTYAPTISTIQKRQYVVKTDKEGVEREYKLLKLKDDHIAGVLNKETTGAEKAKLFPEDIGLVVNDFLVEHFDNVLDYNFTANVEKEFDRIAAGETEWNTMIKQFYSPFHTSVENTIETSERATGERNLGTDPGTGKPVIVRIGKYGPMVQLGNAEDEEKPKFASLLKDQSIESITFEEALELFKLPRTIGVYEDEEITAAIGRFGPYLRHKNKFYSLKGDDDPMTVELERSIELIEEKRKADKEKTIKVFEDNKDVQVLAGRYGPYISIGRNNYKIPKDQEPSELTLEQCLEIAENAPKKKGRRFGSGKKK